MAVNTKVLFMMLDMKMRIQFEELNKLGDKRIALKKEQALKKAGGVKLKAIEEEGLEKEKSNKLEKKLKSSLKQSTAKGLKYTQF